MSETEASKAGSVAPVRGGGHPHPRGPRGGARAPRHVHRVDRRGGAAPPRLRGRGQLGRRGARGLLQRDLRHHPHRQLRDRRRRRPRHPRRPPRVRARRGRGRPHEAPRGRQVRQGGLQGLGRPPRRRHLGGERPQRVARRRDLPRGQGLPPDLLARRAADPPRADRGHRPARHEGHLQARPADLRDDDLQLRHALPAPARAVLPQPRHPHLPRGRARQQEAPLPVRGRDRVLRRAPQPQQGDDPREAHRDHGRARRRRRRGRAAVERRLRREHPLLREQHQHPRRREPPRRLPRGAHPRAQRLRGRGGPPQGGRGLRGRGLPRGAVRGHQRQGPEPAVRGPDEGQARQLRGQGHRREPGQRAALVLPRGAPAGREADRGEDPRRLARARGGAQGARPHPPQGRARRRGAAREARRVPGAEPREVRAVPRGGRLGRRLGQAGPRPRVPGDPARCAARS